MSGSIHQLVSVIMPTYNRAGLIMETIESIRGQTYSNWELIIVDDGSDDNTGELIAALTDDRIQFIKAGRIGIGGIIKNIGMAKARGEFIAFIDSDDLWAMEKLEKQVAVLQQYPEAGFCLTGGYIFRIKNEPEYFFYGDKQGMRVDDLFPGIFKSEVVSYTQALMIRKECLQKTGLFKEEKSFSDLDFIIDIASAYKGIILYESLLYRRLHPENFTASNTWEKSCLEGIEIIQENRKKLQGSVANAALFRAYIQLGEKYLVNFQRNKALNSFLKAWKHKVFSIVPVKKIMKTGINWIKFSRKEHGEH